MEKIKNIIMDNKIFVVIAICIILTIFMPLTQSTLIIGDDYLYHISRIQSIADDIKLGNFPVKIHSQMANSYGYASGIFYPNLFFYFPAILTLLGFHVITSYKIFIFFMLILMFGICFISLKNITSDSKCALIGTIIIMLSRNLILNLYHRSAIGEFLGFMFIPLIIAGMYDYIHNDFKKTWMIVIGFWGVINTHVLTTVICVFVTLFYFLINIKTTIENPKKFGKLVLCALIVALLTISFWLPAIEQHFSQVFKYAVPWSKIGGSEYTLIDLLGDRRYSVGLLITMIMPIFIYVLLDKNIEKNNKKFIYVTLILMGISIWHWFWKVTNDFTNVIQFKWRMVGLITVFSGISLAIIVKEYKEKIGKNIENLIIGILAIAVFLTIEFINFDNRTYKIATYDDVKRDVYTSIYSLGGGQEYFPVNMEYEKLFNPHQVFGNKGTIISLSKNALAANFMKETDDTIFVVPYVYYYGYVAHLEKENGEIVPLEVEKSEDGFVELHINPEDMGKVNVWYNGTKIQKISYIITACSYIGLVIYIVIKKVRLNKKETKEVVEK